MKVAFQGTEGSYSEIAIEKHFGKGAEAKGYPSFEETFKAVKSGEADVAVIPFENSNTGSLVMNYDMLLENDLRIIGEVLVPIEHKLLSKKGNRLENIRVVYSHPQALEQCRDFIRKHKLTAVPEFDTAGAAKLVGERGRKEEAAIASERCAGIYCLDIIEKDVDKDKKFVTKFFVLSREKNVPRDIRKEKTFIVFKTKHYPGALVSCLQRLAKNDVNLTKLESRPVPKKPWEYRFYVEFMGGADDECVKLSLSELEASAEFLEVLGSYPAAKK